MQTLLQDLRYGARMLVKRPGSTVIAVLTLSLGIGANTAIFSVVNTVLLNPLPFAASDRLMALGQNSPSDRAALSNFSFLNFADVRSQSQAFERLAAYYSSNFTLTGQIEAALLRGAIVTADLFPVELGFDPHNVLAFNVAMPVDRSTRPPQIADFYRRLTEGMKALPAVINASVIFQMPLGGNATTGLGIKGQPLDPANQPEGIIHMSGPEYFRTMGIPLVKGREFTEQDDLNSAPVLIINEALARQCFPNENPIGKLIAPGFRTVPIAEEHDWREIIGVVADVKHRSRSATPQPEIYFAQAQMPIATMTVVARTANDPHSLINAARGVVQSLDKNAPVYGLRTVEELISRSVAAPRFNTLLLGLFAAVALILTMVGLYGVISCAVSQATHEIGIRMALGAQTSDVMKLVLMQGITLTVVGLVIGLTAAFGLTRLMSKMLFGVQPTDPLTFVVISLLLLGVTLVACYLPARRATRVDPMVALRYE